VGLLPRLAAAQVAAIVNGQPIEKAEVDAMLKEALGKRNIQPQALPALQAQALEQVIDQRLVAAALEREKLGAKSETIALEIDKFTKDLAARGQTLADFLQKSGQSEATWRRKVAWQLNWKHYTAVQMTDQALATFFYARRGEFDGTQVRVSHLLLAADESATAESIARLVARATELKRQLARRQLTFAQAVQQHSAGTKAGGGDLGFISRHGSMPEPISRAAFELGVGQVSDPLVTPFGVHLILVTEIKRGDKSLDDVRPQVELALKQELFETLALNERSTARIEYTGQVPHFKPGTREVVVRSESQ
jgi:parvulin-like peptidyl-prolyl isomerase